MSTVSMTLGALPLVERIFGGNLRVTACCDETEIKPTSEFEVPLGSMLAFQKTCWQRFLEVKLGLQTKNWQILCQIHIRSASPIFLIKLISKVDLRLKCQLICCLWVFNEIFWQELIRAFFCNLFRQLMSLVLDVGLKSYLFCYTYSWVKRIWCTVISQESDFARRFFLVLVAFSMSCPSHHHFGQFWSLKAWAKSRIKVFPGILPGCIKASIIIQRYTFLEICTVQDTGRNKLPRSTRIAHTTQNQRCSAWICLLDAIPNRGICPSPTIQTPKETKCVENVSTKTKNHDKVVSKYVLFFAAAPSGIPIHLRSKQKMSLKCERGAQTQALPGGPVLSFQNPR